MNDVVGDNQQKKDIRDLSLGQKIDVVKKSLIEMYNGLQAVEVRGHGNMQMFMKSMNTIIDLDQVLEMVLEEVMNLEVPNKEIVEKHI